MESSTATRAAVEATSIADAFRRTVEAHGDRVAFRTHDDAVSLTWTQARDRVDAIAGGLAELGLEAGDTLALLLSNRPEFHLCDLAAMTLRATPFSIYNTYAPEQIAYVVGDAEAKIAVTETALLPGLLAAREQVPSLEHIVVVDPTTGPEAGGARPPEGGRTLAEVEAAGAGFDGDAAAAEVGPEDLLTLIYTSGTTGPPKGVQLVHRNMLAGVASVQELIKLEPGARVISWLPAAHIAERSAHHYLPIVFAATVTTCDNPREIISFLP